MRELSPRDILHLWELGATRHPVESGLTMLVMAEPEATWDELADLPLGRREARLLALRELTFGSALSAHAECPRCGEHLEVGIDTRAIQDSNSMETQEVSREWSSSGYVVSFRLPTSRDLLAAADCGDAEAGVQLLVERCVLASQVDGEPVEVEELPPPVLAGMDAAMEKSDPLAETLVALRCPYCVHEWRAPLDIADFFWRELSAHARRLLCEIHALARAYGWSEADVLALSSFRRQTYLELAGA